MCIYQKRTLPIFYLLFSSSLLLFCNKNPAETGESSTLPGTWSLSKITSIYEGITDTITQSQLDSIGLIWTLIFKKNGSAEQLTNISRDLINMQGTWETKNSKLILIFIAHSGETGTMEYEYVLSDDFLNLNWQLQAGVEFDAVFTKQYEG